MKFLSVFIGLTALLAGLTQDIHAQQPWPKAINGSDGTIVKIYEWQPESFSNNQLQTRAAISVLVNGKTDPVFGVAWFDVKTSTVGDQVEIHNIEIKSLKLPEDIEDYKLENIRTLIEKSADHWNITLSLSELQSAVEVNRQQTVLSNQIRNAPPKILYSATPSILVVMDGDPKIEYNKEWETDAVVNTPFTIVKNDGRFYLYGGKHWYSAPAATGPYQLTTSVSQQLQSIQNKVNDAGKTTEESTETDDNTIYKIIVSTEPAELIQSNGEARFSAIENSGLLYVSNSENDIFMDVNSQDYYVLLAGRWYKSKTLSGNWLYISSDNLPNDFARIPEGSPKDNVLASIAGTEAAKEALEDAEVPQTAKINRNEAKADVIYDGQPEFDVIDGTEMAYATNTSASVIRWRGRFYSVDNGVWFESASAMGPWFVSVSRPYAVAFIPPRYPVYHMKYVYIYEVTPDYVWMGYTPGYLNTFIYGPTIVYGTGYYYRPWHRRYYFPRPYTWGFSVRYNPWFGWGIGFSFRTGWFNGGFYYGQNYAYGGGWWGPRNYRPSYCWSPYNYRGGYYGRSSISYGRNRGYNQIYRSYNANNNIYRNRAGIVSRTYSRNYSPERRSVERGSWSYNERGRNSNIQRNSVEELNNRRSDGGYNASRNNTNRNGNEPRRITPQDMRNNSQYNNRNENTPNRSRNFERITPGTENRDNNPRTYGRENSPQGRIITENGSVRRQPSQNTRDWRPNNNSRVEQPSISDRAPLQRREMINPQQNQSRIRSSESDRIIRQQPVQRQSERREMITPNPSARAQGGNPSRPNRVTAGESREGNRRVNR